MAYCSVSNVTETSVTLTLKGASTATTYPRTVQFVVTDGAWGGGACDSYLAAYTANSTSCTIYGLDPGTYYDVEWYVVRDSDGQIVNDFDAQGDYASFTTDEEEIEEVTGCIVLDTDFRDTVFLQSSNYNPDTRTLTATIRMRFANNGDTYDAIYLYYSTDGNTYNRKMVELSAHAWGSKDFTCTFYNIPDTGQYDFQYVYYSDSNICGTQISGGEWFRVTWTPTKKFWWKSQTDRPAPEKDIAEYISANTWNSLCFELGLDSLAFKSAGDEIIGTEVRQVILALGGSAANYPTSDFQKGQPCLAQWFTAIEDLYNG